MKPISFVCWIQSKTAFSVDRREKKTMRVWWVFLLFQPFNVKVMIKTNIKLFAMSEFIESKQSADFQWKSSTCSMISFRFRKKREFLIFYRKIVDFLSIKIYNYKWTRYFRCDLFLFGKVSCSVNGKPFILFMWSWLARWKVATRLTISNDTNEKNINSCFCLQFVIQILCDCLKFGIYCNDVSDFHFKKSKPFPLNFW